MKNILVAALVSLFFTACSKKENPADSSSKNDETVSAAPVLSGKELTENSDCMSCHNAEERMIGPSYREIAAKYSEKDIDLLALKIIEGGSGVWGEVAMQPHSQISKEDAKKMVAYILSQKK